MKLSSVDLDYVKKYCNIYFDDDDDLIEDIIIPSAKGYIQSYTKRTLEELDKYNEIAIVFLILCAYMYDNRGLEISSEGINVILKQTLGMHSYRILGGVVEE